MWFQFIVTISKLKLDGNLLILKTQLNMHGYVIALHLVVNPHSLSRSNHGFIISLESHTPHSQFIILFFLSLSYCIFF
jgi:hypothetical protein